MVARNDIYWAHLGPPAGRRPVCVLTRDAAIDVLASFTCAPITRTIRGIRSDVAVGPAPGPLSRERLDSRGWQRLAAGLRTGDPDGQVTAAWQLKELARGLFRATSVDRAREVFAIIDAWAATIDAPECRRLVRTLHRWDDEILAFHTTGGVTNARTEATNLGIKAIKRVGRGFRNFINYRLRLLLSCGGVNWQDHPAARLRGRGPQLVA